MMNTDKFTEKISLWIDNELNAAEVAELQTHIKQCEQCRHVAQAMTRLDAALRAAAAEIVAPGPHFAQQVEARLPELQPVKVWQMWLALAALVAGGLLFVGAWVVVGGVTLVSVGTALLDTRLVSQGAIRLIETANELRLVTSLGLLALKTSFITIQQPVFWLCAALAVLFSWLWVRLMRTVARRGAVTVDLLI